MNIFYLHPDPVEAAKQICIVHQNKMLVESCQLLSTAHHVLDGKGAIDGVYKESHTNHPSAIWVRERSGNYQWLFTYACALADLYKARSRKFHKSEDILENLSELPKNIKYAKVTEPPACVDADIKRLPIHVVQKYRKQINRKYKEWQLRAKPVAVVPYPSKPEWWSV